MPKLVNSVKSRSARFADLADYYVDSPEDVNFYDMNCWQAVFEVGRRSGAISNRGVQKLLSEAQPQNPGALIADGDDIRTAGEMRRVKPGRIVIFSGRGYHGGERLVHVMVSLGDGMAAGLNNGPIRGSPAWVEIDLAARWNDRGVEGYHVYVRDLTDISQSRCYVQ